MSQLGTFFLILTPFGFFCTENGTGLITGTVFLMLGILFKYLAKNGGGNSVGTTAKCEVTPENFWKFHFLRLYNGFNEKSQPWAVRDARESADAIARYNGVTPPSDARFEQLAKEMGIKTDKVRDAEIKIEHRVRTAERIYMNELIGRYKKLPVFDPYIKPFIDMANEIPFYNPETDEHIWTLFGVSAEELEETLKKIPESERKQGKKIVEEFNRQVYEPIMEGSFKMYEESKKLKSILIYNDISVINESITDMEKMRLLGL